MKRILRLWPEESAIDERGVTVRAVVERTARPRMDLWFRLPADVDYRPAESCDPFVVATVFAAMAGDEMRVEGPVSPSLLANLEEFQAIWAGLRPQRYRRVEIRAQAEREAPAIGVGAVAAFSGGADSCFTLLRHVRGNCGRRCHDLRAAVMVHGFDIPLADAPGFERASRRAEGLLADLGVPLIPVATNFRELGVRWEDAFGAAVASALMLFGGRFRVGLIGSSEPYHNLVTPWGSHPLTDPLLSSTAFNVVHDGATHARVDKLRALAAWPAALAGLRVCWEGPERDRNCGRCEKCVRTILGFRAVGVGLPPCFDRDVSDAEVRALRGLSVAQYNEFAQVLAGAEQTMPRATWVRALRAVLARERWRNRFRAFRRHGPWGRAAGWLRSLRALLPDRLAVRYRYRSNFQHPRDWLAVGRFLLCPRYAVPLSLHARWQMLRDLHRIAQAIDCPHTQHEILPVLAAILATPREIVGCVVEAGSYKGGSTAKLSLAARLAGRRLVVFDSFEGIPSHEEPHARNIFGDPAGFATGDWCGSLTEVQDNVARVGAAEVCEYRKGWFDATLPRFDAPVAVAFIDVDLAASTRTCVRYLYPRLVPGGALYSQDGHLPLVIETLADERFWREEFGIERPQIEGLGRSKLICIRKPEAA